MTHSTPSNASGYTSGKAPANVFLVGMMAVGKTTVGRHLAEALGFDFVDSDREIETRTGIDIPWIFEKEGEAGFRDREAKVIADLVQRRGMVLATGGGAVLRCENRRLLREHGAVVYLQADLEVLKQRAAASKGRKRPLLQDKDAAVELKRIFAEREPLYREAAHHSVDISRDEPEAIAQRIKQLLFVNPGVDAQDGRQDAPPPQAPKQAP